MFGFADQNLLVQQMREELTDNGFAELRTPADVDAAMRERGEGTTLLVINSVCGCAAGGCRPGVVASLDHARTPDRLLTVFAGQDRDATEQARGYLENQPPSSPAVALLRDGKLVFMLHRGDIEGYTAEQIAQRLKAAYDQHCVD